METLLHDECNEEEAWLNTGQNVGLVRAGLPLNCRIVAFSFGGVIQYELLAQISATRN